MMMKDFFGYDYQPGSKASKEDFYSYYSNNNKFKFEKLQKFNFKNLKPPKTFGHILKGIEYFYKITNGQYNAAKSNCQTFVMDILYVLTIDFNWDNVILDVNSLSNQRISKQFELQFKALIISLSSPIDRYQKNAKQ